jgi:hypothetical protein
VHQHQVKSIRNGVRDLVLGATLLALLTLGGAYLSPTPTRAAADPTAALSVAEQPLRVTSTCWITGDLVGDANPAVIDATFCSSRP